MITVKIRCDSCGKYISENDKRGCLSWKDKTTQKRKDLCSDCITKVWQYAETLPHHYTQLKTIGKFDDE